MVFLSQIIQTKKVEIEQGKSKGLKTKRRGQSMSATIAALKEPIEESDDENDDNIETEGDGPLWQLFDQLYNSANASGKKTLSLFSRTPTCLCVVTQARLVPLPPDQKYFCSYIQPHFCLFS